MDPQNTLQHWMATCQSASFPLIGSLLLVAFAFFLRLSIGRAIRQNDKLLPEVRGRWLVTLRNGTLLLLMLGLMVLWAEELRVAAVSMFAIAAATVIALKELLQCISGSVLRTVSRGFAIGDRIEINGFRGDVIDHNALTTTILEIGPCDLTQQHTGRAIALPNCLFLNQAVVNETFTDEYVLHVFKVPIAMDANWQLAEAELLEAANVQCEPYINEARRHFEKLGETQGITTLSVEPRVTVLISATGGLELIVRIAVPARKKGRVEQAILRQLVSTIVARIPEVPVGEANYSAERAA